MEALFSQAGIYFIFKWIHFLAGVVWIGHLYYFNFVQGSFFNEIEASTKNVAVQKLVPRALWWFRWGAMFTFLSGLVMLIMLGHQGVSFVEFYSTAFGTKMLIGALLGTLMFLNVWLIIWPHQKIVIASTNQVLSGGQALPQAAMSAAKAALASRTNTLFSIPMLFFMGAGRNIPNTFSDNVSLATLWTVLLIIIGGLEINAIKGKMGPLTTVKGVITSGFVLTAVLYIIYVVLT